MANIKRSWDLLSAEKKKKAVQGLVDFFQTERDEEIGIIAAENILDYFLQSVGIQLYNKGIEASANVLRERFESLELDVEAQKR